MKRNSILVVDDVELNRAILSELFCKDYQVLEAEDGSVALRLIEKAKDHLSIILLDILMPTLDGFGVLKWMGEQNLITSIPVIMITAENSEQTALRGYEMGVTDVINKPFSPSIVRRRVENTIALNEYRTRLEHIISVQKMKMDRQAQKLDRIGTTSFAQRIFKEDVFPLEPAIQVKPTQDGDAVSRRVLWLLELEREKYRLLSEMTGDIVFNYDWQSDIMEFTESFQSVFGGNARQCDFREKLMENPYIYEEDRADLLEKMQQIYKTPKRIVFRVRMVTMKKNVEWFEAYVQPLMNQDDNQCVGLIGKIVNINDIKQEADRWKEEAYHDALTQLYNRKAVEEMALSILQINQETSEQSILFFVDIDNFKQLNDRFGHRFGDTVLKYVSREMQRKFRSSDIVGRIGGDEFVILANGIREKKDIERKAQELCEIFREAVNQGQAYVAISGSVGIARYPQDAHDYEDLLHKADVALYQAKSWGKNCYAFYTDTLDSL